MEILSLQAVVFLAAAVCALALPLPDRARRVLLVAANLAFLALLDPIAPAVFLAVSLGAFGIAHLAARGLPRAAFALLTIPLVAVLIVPKTGLLGAPAAGGEAGLVAALSRAPAYFVGSSYFTLRALHFAIDAARERRVALGLLDFLAWNGFFATILAGPIERAQHFTATLPRLGRPSLDDLEAGFARIFVGLLKKVVAAQLAWTWAAPLVSRAPSGAGEAWLALYAFGLYVYFDFAGYSDLAIGAARLCGIGIAENFDNPYRSASIAEFWRRWHITLSTWIRDYAFLPLCGRSASRVRPKLAAVASMTLCGLWHGPTLAWAAWGAAHGSALAVHSAWLDWIRKRFAWKRRLERSRVASVAATLLTFHFVTVTWVFAAFGEAGPRAALSYAAQLVGQNTP